jgi:hypothetical protein
VIPTENPNDETRSCRAGASDLALPRDFSPPGNRLTRKGYRLSSGPNSGPLGARKASHTSRPGPMLGWHRLVRLAQACMAIGLDYFVTHFGFKLLYA